jgi:ribosomal protein S18 acetylase RimI-like enzyme
VFPYRLERARPSDATRLAAMSRAFIEAGLRPAWSAARITRHVHHPECVVLTARLTATLAGFAIMCYAQDSAHLNLLAVDPAHRRRGIARRLLGWLEATALTAGTFIVSLELRASNEGARAFYRSLGYRELALVPDYYQGVEAALRMERDVRTCPTAAPSTPQSR